VLAVLAAIWSLVHVVNTADAASAAAAIAAQVTKMPGGIVVAPDPAVPAAARAARTMAVFTAVVVGLLAVAVPLFLAEVLKLTIIIENNTRKTTHT
jgi:hypothetical protein